jgi:transcriptional regulator with XRE-family HTH domain
VSTFGERLRAFRGRAGLSQNRLAREAGIDPAYVNRLERASLGDSRAPTRRVVLSLASALTLGPVDRERLLVAAGLCPESVARLESWDPTLGAVADVLGNANLSDDDRADFRALIRIAASRWQSQR